MKIRATIIELWKRVVESNGFDSKKIYKNGENNLYPNEVERVINNSPTAFRCAKLMANYIAGNLAVDDIIVNKKKGYKLSKVVSLASRSIAYQGGVFFHVGYGFDEETAKIKQISLDILDYCKCRISKEDTEENPGKIYFKDYEKKQDFGFKNDENWFYPYNPNQNVVLSQIKADNDKEEIPIIDAIKNYRGQVFYLNLTPEYIYSLPCVDSVFNDADSEFRFGVYTNKQMRSGFLGKTAVLTQGLDEESSKKVKTDIAEFLGAENADSIYHLDVEQAENLDNVLKFVQLKAQFDDKLFEQTEKRIRRNILGAFNNIPEPLILADSGALFGTNADTYEQMKIFYSQQTELERKELESVLKYLGFNVVLNPIAKPATQTTQQVDLVNKQTQTALKSDVESTKNSKYTTAL